MEGAARVKGVSFYECESTPGTIERRGEDGVVSQVKGKEVRVTYVRDIPESTLKPPPLQALAAAIKPDLRTFKPLLREQQAVGGVVLGERDGVPHEHGGYATGR